MLRRPPRRAARPAAVFLTALVVLGACTGDDDTSATTSGPDTTVSAATFAEVLCAEVAPIPEQMAAITEREIPEGADPDAERQVLLDNLETLQATVRGTEEAVASAPPPGVPGGPETADRYERALRQADQQLGQVISFISSAQEATPEVLFEGFAVLPVMQNLFAVFAGDPVPIPVELNDAFNANEDCQAFAAASAGPEPQGPVASEQPADPGTTAPAGS